MFTPSEVKRCKIVNRLMPRRQCNLAVHFVLVVLSIFPVFACTAVLADDFVEVSPGHFVRFGAHAEMGAAPEQGESPEFRKGIANIGFIVGRDAVVVIDPGGTAADAIDLNSAITARTKLPVSHVILTHFHPDHVLAGQAFSNVPNVVAHRRYTAAMTQRGDFYLDRFKAYISSVDEVSWLRPTLEVDTSLILDLGDRKLHIRAYPTAHTDNDISIYDQKTKTLWASDLVFAQRIPSLDGSLTGWLAVLAEIKNTLPSLIIPGHGKAGNWQQVVEPQIRYLSSLAAQTREAIMQEVSLAELTAKLTTHNDSEWLLYELNHLRNVTKAYTELEWE